MFGLFVDNVLRNFWGNSMGDLFLVNTCNKLEINISNVHLMYYAGLKSKPEFYSFDGNKALSILNQVSTPTQVAALDENGDPVLDENLDPIFHNEDVITYEVQSTIQPDPYFSGGIFVKPC
jgi:hypothetical protein